jgi:AcrR family transcriptional regulator
MQPLDTAHKRTPAFDSKRLHLLDAAARVFSAEGYDRASMRRIAAEARVSLAAIYHYVASKQELLYWIQSHTFDSLLRGLQASLEGIVDPRQRLAAAVRNHVRHFGRNMHELKVCARELETLEGEAYEEVHVRRRAYFEAVHALVKALPPSQRAPLSSWLATANLFGMLNWFYQWYDAERSRVSLDDLAAQQTALFLDGYAAAGGGAGDGGSR